MCARAVIGDWYLSHNNKARFEVVALDDVSGTIDVQYFDGSIGEFDLETWNELDVEGCPEPEDCSGVYEMEFDEIDDTDESATAEPSEYELEGLQVIHESEFDRELSF